SAGMNPKHADDPFGSVTFWHGAAPAEGRENDPPSGGLHTNLVRSLNTPNARVGLMRIPLQGISSSGSANARVADSNAPANTGATNHRAMAPPFGMRVGRARA